MVLDLYKNVLSSINCVVDEDGMISFLLGDTALPCTIKDKRLVLPIPAILKNPSWEHQIAFHPLSESILRGESPVMQRLKLLASVRLTEVICCLTTELMEIAVNKDTHRKLSPTESEFLSLIPNVDAKTLHDVERLFEETSIDGEHKVISMYLKRGGKWKGKNFQRVAVTDFPILTDLKAEGKKVFGVTLHSLKNKAAICTLLNYILPHADEPEHYSYGSNSTVAPYFHAFMTSYRNVAKQLNKITKKFRKHLDNPDGLMIDLNFEAALDNLSDYIDMIPSLSGNEGEVAEPNVGSEVALTSGKTKPNFHAALLEANKVAPAPQVASSAPAPMTTTPPWDPQPNTPAPASTGGGLSWDKVVQSNPAWCQQFGQPVVPMVTFLQQQQQPQYNVNPFVHNPNGFSGQPAYQPQPQMTRGGYLVQPQHQPRQMQTHYQPQYQPQQVMFPNGI